MTAEKVTPIPHLRLWAGDEDITAQFVIDEGPDEIDVVGPSERLTRYTVDDDARIGQSVHEADRAAAARVAAAGGTFHLTIPNHYMRAVETP